MGMFIIALAILASLSGLTLLGFVIVLIVGFSIKKEILKKIGKLGSIIAGTIFVISLSGFFITQKIQNDEEVRIEKENEAQTKEMDKKFLDQANKFVDVALEAVTTGEEVASNIHDGWGKAIDASTTADDFDVNKTISNLIVENVDDISDMSKNLDKMKKILHKIEENDTGTYEFDSDFYNKMYEHVSDYINFVSAPSGSYSTFVDDANDYHQKILKDYRSLK